MEGAPLCHCGQALELGFRTLTLQEWRRGSLSTRGMLRLQSRGGGRGGGVARGQKRLRIAKADASGYASSRAGGRVGFKDGSDSGDGERGLRTSRDGETGSRRRAAESDSRVELAAHVDTITSVQNPFVKHLVKLRTNTNYRNAAGCVVVVGSVPLR
jgi:hypothetical protein